MSAKTYNKTFPRYIRYKQDRPIPSWMSVVRPSMMQVPLYYLGWMVKVKDVGRRCIALGGVLQYLVRPNWSKHGCEPTKQADFDRQGLMMPDAAVFGRHHVFIRIASNDRDAMKYLHTEAGIKNVVRQAFLGLGLKEGSFDPFKDLMWVRWPQGETFPEPSDNFPCIGEHYWPHQNLWDQYMDRKLSREEYEQALTHAKEELQKQGPPEEVQPKGTLPQVPPEIVFIITQQYYMTRQSDSE